MGESKSFLTGRIFNTGAPAKIGLTDETTEILSEIVKTMTFTGDNIVATSDAQGNVQVEVLTQTTVEIVDGGNF